NRYVGADRVSDADQVSLGVTSRLFDTRSGAQFLSATLGQTYYFQNPRVHLPDEPVRNRATSDFIAELAVTAYKHWNANFGIQGTPAETRGGGGEGTLKFRPGEGQVITPRYRSQRDPLGQTAPPAACPTPRQWNFFGRYVYSIQDKKALEQFAGLEYSSCCWR